MPPNPGGERERGCLVLLSDVSSCSETDSERASRACGHETTRVTSTAPPPQHPPFARATTTRARVGRALTLRSYGAPGPMISAPRYLASDLIGANASSLRHQHRDGPAEVGSPRSTSSQCNALRREYVHQSGEEEVQQRRSLNGVTTTRSRTRCGTEEDCHGSHELGAGPVATASAFGQTTVC